MAEILEKELSYTIVGCVYSTANKYGRGLKEKIYQKLLSDEFKKAGLKFSSQKRINIYSFDTGEQVGVYIPDFLVEEKILVEIKASTFTTRQDIEQQRSYLRISAYEIAYLINFCTEKLYIERSIYTNDRKPFIAKITK